MSNTIQLRDTQGNAKYPVTEASLVIGMPSALSDLTADSTHRTVTDAEKATWNGKYTKPASGIPASDIASGVIPTVPTDVVKYTSQSLTDAQKTQARTNIGAGTYSKPSGGIPASDLASGVIPDAVSANPTVPSGTTPTALTGLKIGSNYYDVEAGGGTVTDVTVGGTSVVDANGVAEVPEIPEAVQAQEIEIDSAPTANSSNLVTSGGVASALAEKYSKPSGGIPSTDLAADAVPVIPVDTAIPSGGLDANVHYDLGTLTGSVSITLDATSAVSGMLNIYSLSFTAGSTAPTITWPSSITNWAGNCLDSTTLAPVITGGNSYEVTIRGGLAVITEFVAS